MKNRIIFFETEYLTLDKFSQMIDTDLFNIVGAVTASEDIEESETIFRIDLLSQREAEWDYFLCFSTDHEILTNIFDLLGLDQDKLLNMYLVYYFSFSQIQALIKMLLPNNELYLKAVYKFMTLHNKYVSITAEELTFSFNSLDRCIPENMFITKKVWSADDMHLLKTLLERYYTISSDTECYFMDIGANIGTTSVYVKKNILPKSKIYAFEPIKDNYKLLHSNLILNDVTDFEICNTALSSHRAIYNMTHVTGNMGMCEITDKEIKDGESVSSISLDEFILENKLGYSLPYVLWIDTEGFEIDVILGCTNLLKTKPAIFFEYNPGKYGNRVNELIDILSKYYSGYIDTEKDTSTVIYGLEKLINPIYEQTKQTNLFLIP